MKRRRAGTGLSLALGFLLLFAAAGCGAPSPAPGGGDLAGASGKRPKVALVTAGSLADSGWNSLAGKALEQMQAELGAQTSHQSTGKAQAEEALRGYARNGYGLIFAHGSEFQDAARRVAAENPGASFVVSSGAVEGPNLASLRFDLGEASYLAGMAAAGLSKTGKAGQIGGESFPPVVQAFELFERGGRVVNPAFSAPITYLGNWHDSSAAKEKALAMIRGGADILFQNADAAGEGVFLAAEEQGVLVVGSNADQNELKPETIVASAVLDVGRSFMSLARDWAEERFKGGIYRQDLKSGNVYLAINPKFAQKIPAAVREQISQAEKAIKEGRLRLLSP